MDTAIPALAELGYDGIEIPLKAILQYGKHKFKAITDKYNMKVIVMVMTDGPVAPGAGLVFGGPYPGFTQPSQPGDRDKAKIVATHIQVFKEQVEAAQEFRPYLVNSHSCKDYFTTSMALEYFCAVVDWCKSRGGLSCLVLPSEPPSLRPETPFLGVRSKAIKSNQKQLKAFKSNQKQSKAIESIQK